MSSDGRSARVNTDADGEPLGVTLFLTPEELSELGIKADSIDTVHYTVIEGEIRLLAHEKKTSANL